MKSPYVGLWLLLAVSLSIFLLVAFSDDITLAGHTLKKAPFRSALLGETSSSDSLYAPLDSLDSEAMEQEITVSTDSTPKSILLIGDSMTFNIALRMAKYARQNGHQFHAVNWDSSNTKIWAESDTLRYYMDKYKADYIFISLGSNEVYFKDPSVRMPYVRKILSVIDTVPYVWIGPPNWNEDTGINDMLARVCRRGSFFRSEGMTFERKKDKIHPTRKASELWVDSIMRWMPHSAHPILADSPSDSLGKVANHVIFLKALNK